MRMARFSHEPDMVYVAFGGQVWVLGLRSNSRNLLSVLPSPQVQITDMAQHQENPRLWSTAQADGSLSVWTCNDNAGRPVVLYSGRIGSDCSQGSPLDKSFLVRFSAVDDHVVLLTGASMGASIMWFDWKKNAVCQVLSLEHVAVSMDACPTRNLVAIGTRDRVIKLIDFQHATLQDHVAPLGSQDCVAFSPDASMVSCVSSTEIWTWNLRR